MESIGGNVAPRRSSWEPPDILLECTGLAAGKVSRKTQHVFLRALLSLTTFLMLPQVPEITEEEFDAMLLRSERQSALAMITMLESHARQSELLPCATRR